MIYRHTLQQIEDYRQLDAVNQSSLKHIIEYGIQSFVNNAGLLVQDRYYEEKEHFIIGSAVDCKLTGERGDFEELYYISTLAKKPSASIMSIVKQLYNDLTNSGADLIRLGSYRGAILDICNDQTYYTNRKDDTRINTVVEEGDDYFNDLKRSFGKQVLSDEQASLIETLVASFTSHPHTQRLFIDEEGIDLIFQFPTYWTDNNTGLRCKGLLDLVKINHNQNLIMPVDFKTDKDDVLLFNKTVKKRRYDLQAAFYTEAIKHSLAALSRICGKDVTGYQIRPFAFAVESKKSPGTPMVFPLEPSLLEVGKNGTLWMPGWVGALDNYRKWVDADFNLERRFKNNFGVLFINSTFDYQLKF